MAEADVAVSAAGSTCWELARMRLPSLLVAVAENQTPLAREMAAAGAAVDLGPVEQLTATSIAKELSALCRDQDRRMSQSAAGARLVDGQGAQRVAGLMNAFAGSLPPTSLRPRPVAADDELPLWRLANDPVVRANSLSTDPIPLGEHVAWFRRKLADAATRIWVLELHGVILGVIRYDRTEPDTAEISFHVAAAFRRRGLGTRLLDETSDLAHDALEVRRLRAIVRHENLASARTCAKAGFVRVDPRTVRDCPCHVFERLQQ